MTWTGERQLRLASETAPARPGIACIVPLYQEQDIAADTVRFWHDLASQGLFDLVVVVTTAKEQAEPGGTTTHDIAQAELARLGECDRLALVQCSEVTRFRASQLNLAVQHAHATINTSGSGELWIGVYNADSRPQPQTFAELRLAVADDPATRVYQQLVDYVVPGRDGVKVAAVGNAVLQTWWTMGTYPGRSARGRSGHGAWAKTAPYSTFGHGEFIRSDLLETLGGFPDFAYADGLLLGWICRLAGEPIGLLASRDIAEVPRNAQDLVTQQTAWLRGLLNFNATVAWCRQQGLLKLSDAEVKLLRVQHLAIPAAWGLSTAAVTAGLLITGRRVLSGKGTAADYAGLLGLLTYPLIPALVPTSSHHRVTPLSQRALGTLVSWQVEGLAFWPALRSHLLRNQQAPQKTPR